MKKSINYSILVLKNLRFQILIFKFTVQSDLFQPKDFRKITFNSIHNICYASANKRSKLKTEKFIWPGMKKDCQLLTWIGNKGGQAAFAG